MLTTISRRLLASSVIAAVLWLLFAGARWALLQTQGPIAQLATLLPELVPTALLWGESGGWLIAVTAAGGLTVALVYAVFTLATGRGGDARLVPAWFATVAAGKKGSTAIPLDEQPVFLERVRADEPLSFVDGAPG